MAALSDYETHCKNAREFLSLADMTGNWAEGMTPTEVESVRAYHAHAQVEALLAIAAALNGGKAE